MFRKEDHTSKRRLAGSRITSTISIALVLLAIGLVGLFLLHGKKIRDYVRENAGFTIYINKNVKEADIVQLQKELDADEYVRSTEYISEEKAAEEYQKDLGVDFVKFIGYNPLHTSIEVHFKSMYADDVFFNSMINDIKKKPIVEDVTYFRPLLQVVNDHIKMASLILLIFSLLLLLICITLIHNTIRLAVYSKRFIIRSMQLVGATEGFIRKPFLKSSALQGLIASFISIALLIAIISILRSLVPEIIELQSIDLFLILFGFIIALGLIISFFSTYFAVKKYLRIKTDYLYY